MDKDLITQEVFKPLFVGFGQMQTNDVWRERRKACAHMFYKTRLTVMIDVFKEHLSEACDRWLSEIVKDGETRINIAEVFENINTDVIIHICFGQNSLKE